MVYTEKYTVRCSEINENQVLTAPALLQIMQEASFQHTLHLKASYWDLKPKGVTWVLLKKDLKIVKPVNLNDEVTVMTCPSSFDRYFAQRDYRCLNDLGECIAYATSQWALIDVKTRKIAPILTQLLDIPCETVNGGETCTFRIKNKIMTHESRVFQVSVYDLDWNQHLNNAVLVKFMLSVLPYHSVTHMQIEFISESILDDTLVIKKGQQGDTFIIEAYNNTRNQLASIARVQITQD